ncbi:hypothetical protein B0H14DRAFT_3885612 [Mycena olivaceomarginata]|nr:hypothetical protein B0H14DRAFT_3885612 [Mycena olivaceomarginata]
MTRYIEKVDGSIVSGKEAEAIRDTQLAIFREIQRVSPDDLPMTWGDASLTVRNFHHAQMYAAHPWLRLCRSLWKADFSATNNYSSWYIKVVKKKAKAKPQIPPVMTKTAIFPLLHPSPPPLRRLALLPLTSPFPEDSVPSPIQSVETSASTTPEISNPILPTLIPNVPPATNVNVGPVPDLSMNSAPPPSSVSPAVLTATPEAPVMDSPAEEATIPQKKIVMVNPLDAVFGAAVGPAGRSNGFTKVTAPPPTSKQGKKRVNKDSLSAPDLFYADYLKKNDAVTPKEFDSIYGALSAEELQVSFFCLSLHGTDNWSEMDGIELAKKQR